MVDREWRLWLACPFRQWGGAGRPPPRATVRLIGLHEDVTVRPRILSHIGWGASWLTETVWVQFRGW